MLSRRHSFSTGSKAGRSVSRDRGPGRWAHMMATPSSRRSSIATDDEFYEPNQSESEERYPNRKGLLSKRPPDGPPPSAPAPAPPPQLPERPTIPFNAKRDGSNTLFKASQERPVCRPPPTLRHKPVPVVPSSSSDPVPEDDGLGPRHMGPDFARLLADHSRQSRELSVARVRLVIAIDFGTTYSGAAYAIVEPTEDPERVRVDIVRGWDGDRPKGLASNKVPTVLAFDEADNGKVYWGFDIPQRLENRQIKFVKLLLEPDVAARVSSLNDVVDPEATGELLKEMQREAVDVAAQYIRCLWEHTKQHIIRDVGETTWTFADKVVLFSVPAVWSERAKHNTYMIAIGAGLGGAEYTLTMISEPEAAAVAVLKDRRRKLALNQDDVFLVVDAGGGTVDLTSYQIKDIGALKLEEVAAGDGDVCGAAFLEVAFLSLLKTYFGTTAFEELTPQNRTRIITSWEDNIRDRFTGDDDTQYALNVPGLPDCGPAEIKDGYWHLSATEIKPIFNSVLQSIRRLIRRQIKSLADRGLRPRAIYLVGGLGCNKYLAKQLKEMYEGNDRISPEEPIEVRQPDVAWESVAHGAVKCDVLGLPSLISLRRARYNIGLHHTPEWKRGIHPRKLRFKSTFTDRWTVMGGIYWVLRRQAELTIDATQDIPYETNVWESDIDAVVAKRGKGLPIHLTLMASTEDNAPDHVTPMTRSFARMTVIWPLDRFPKSRFAQHFSPSGRPYRKPGVVYHMQQNMAGMKFSYSMLGQHLGEVSEVDFQALPDNVEKGGKWLC